MAWNPQGGGPWGGGGGQGPWGRGPSGPRPPDFEDLIRKGQDRFKNLLPGGMGAGKGLIIAVIAVAAIWLANGFYTRSAGGTGRRVAVRQIRSNGPAPAWHWWPPAPIGEVVKPPVTRVNRVQVGFRETVPGQRGSAKRAVPQESLMLTGDENIIDIQAVTFWRISDANKFLFNVRNPATTVKDASESALREIIGKSDFEFVRTQGRVNDRRRGPRSDPVHPRRIRGRYPGDRCAAAEHRPAGQRARRLP